MTVEVSYEEMTATLILKPGQLFEFQLLRNGQYRLWNESFEIVNFFYKSSEGDLWQFSEEYAT